MRLLDLIKLLMAASPDEFATYRYEKETVYTYLEDVRLQIRLPWIDPHSGEKLLQVDWMGPFGSLGKDAYLREAEVWFAGQMLWKEKLLWVDNRNSLIPYPTEIRGKRYAGRVSKSIAAIVFTKRYHDLDSLLEIAGVEITDAVPPFGHPEWNQD